MGRSPKRNGERNGGRRPPAPLSSPSGKKPPKQLPEPEEAGKKSEGGFGRVFSTHAAQSLGTNVGKVGAYAIPVAIILILWGLGMVHFSWTKLKLGPDGAEVEFEKNEKYQYRYRPLLVPLEDGAYSIPNTPLRVKVDLPEPEEVDPSRQDWFKKISINYEGLGVAKPLFAVKDDSYTYFESKDPQIDEELNCAIVGEGYTPTFVGEAGQLKNKVLVLELRVADVSTKKKPCPLLEIP